jgi:hypothetical protein
MEKSITGRPIYLNGAPWSAMKMRLKQELGILRRKGQSLHHPFSAKMERHGWIVLYQSSLNQYPKLGQGNYWRLVLRGIWQQTLLQLGLKRFVIDPSIGEYRRGKPYTTD